MDGLAPSAVGFCRRRYSRPYGDGPQLPHDTTAHTAVRRPSSQAHSSTPIGATSSGASWSPGHRVGASCGAHNLDVGAAAEPEGNNCSHHLYLDRRGNLSSPPSRSSSAGGSADARLSRALTTCTSAVRWPPITRCFWCIAGRLGVTVLGRRRRVGCGRTFLSLSKTASVHVVGSDWAHAVPLTLWRASATGLSVASTARCLMVNAQQLAARNLNAFPPLTPEEGEVPCENAIETLTVKEGQRDHTAFPRRLGKSPLAPTCRAARPHDGVLCRTSS
jgi:hypothetical protein